LLLWYTISCAEKSELEAHRHASMACRAHAETERSGEREHPMVVGEDLAHEFLRVGGELLNYAASTVLRVTTIVVPFDSCGKYFSSSFTC